MRILFVVEERCSFKLRKRFLADKISESDENMISETYTYLFYLTIDLCLVIALALNTLLDNEASYQFQAYPLITGSNAPANFQIIKGRLNTEVNKLLFYFIPDFQKNEVYPK